MDHFYYQIFMILGKKICRNQTLDEFEKGSDLLNNFAANGRGNFRYITIVKTR